MLDGVVFGGGDWSAAAAAANGSSAVAARRKSGASRTRRTLFGRGEGDGEDGSCDGCGFATWAMAWWMTVSMSGRAGEVRGKMPGGLALGEGSVAREAGGGGAVGGALGVILRAPRRGRLEWVGDGGGDVVAPAPALALAHSDGGEGDVELVTCSGGGTNNSVRPSTKAKRPFCARRARSRPFNYVLHVSHRRAALD
ncbi:hypothetical protein BDY21DRAFT_359240 [Lineolata rhizophorae]|uniref:Uncharacterized protein n=1 Tax=Lineolata rhizophorae TaxID=578093 RepID=A0A6A6NLC9_9PEZI|nr:hypothetical protein BDY21DRAFT_359240 [Lineolata rhizophorae]